jgi:RNA polymerase sigma-70 factor, ECF subfamily
VHAGQRIDTEAFSRDPIPLATNFPRFEASGNGLCCHGDPQTRWFDMQFLVDAPIKNTMATTLEADYVFGTKDFELGAKVVKFAVIQGHQGEGAQEHELASFEAMMLPHMDAAHNLARWLLRNEEDAQDVVQEAYLRAFKSFSGFHGSNGRAWLLTIVRNTSYTLLKKNRAVDLTTTFDEQIHASGHESVSPATILEHSEDAALISEAMDELPAELREILTLRHQECLSYKEIADIMQIPPGTVMSRLARARGKLKEYLAARISKDK